MAFWIDKCNAELRRKDDGRHHQQEWQLHVARMLSTLGPSFWQTVIDQTIRYANEWNTNNDEDGHRIETVSTIPGGFLLHRGHYPSVHIEATYDRATNVVECLIRRVESHTANPQEEQKVIPLTLDSNGRPCADFPYRNHVDLARWFVELFVPGHGPFKG